MTDLTAFFFSFLFLKKILIAPYKKKQQKNKQTNNKQTNKQQTNKQNKKKKKERKKRKDKGGTLKKTIIENLIRRIKFFFYNGI